jgi:hypothetical protein
MKDEQSVINYYFYGQELSSDEAPFPFWFEFPEEKIACLLGYNDFEFNTVKTEKEIIEEVKRILT